MMRGRVLYVDGPVVWLARGCRLFRSADRGRTWKKRARLPLRRWREWFALCRLGRRLARVGFHHFIPTGPDSGFAVAHRELFRLDAGCGVFHRVSPLHGSRPYKLCRKDGRIFYGEYRKNPERSPVHVWAGCDSFEHWETVWRFDGVRHVHGVFLDPYTDNVWVATGDENHEAGIWRTSDGFSTLECMASGSQQCRVVQILFADDYIYFASDAPEEPNFIYRMKRAGGAIEQLQAVSGTVFHGCKVGDSLFFSTTVEPSATNTSPWSEIWGSRDGVNWVCVARHKKDILPKKLFQYGQTLFPAGPGDGRNLWFSLLGTQRDEQSFAVPVDHVIS